MTDQWNLVAAGPSRVHLRPAHLLAGPVVTVNRSIDIAGQGICVHFAAFADGPTGCWSPMGLERYLPLQPHIQLWVPMRTVSQKITVRRPPVRKKFVPAPDFLTAVAKILPHAAYRALAEFSKKYLMEAGEVFDVEAPGPTILHLWDRVLPASTGIRELPHGTVADVNDQSKGRTAFTTLCALERIFMFRPKRVRILCADMTGPWIDGKTEEECYAAEKAKAGQAGPALDRWRHERYALEHSIKKANEGFGVEVDWLKPEPEPTEALDGAVVH
jgi:hypothetical protein